MIELSLQCLELKSNQTFETRAPIEIGTSHPFHTYQFDQIKKGPGVRHLTYKHMVSKEEMPAKEGEPKVIVKAKTFVNKVTITFREYSTLVTF